MQPCTFTTKLQTHGVVNLTYNNILRGSSTEKVAWEEAMTKELKYLGGLGSFEMVNRSRGANILQSTLMFKRKRYPDGTLPKYKARFCVRGDHQIDGLDVFDIYAPVVS